MSQTRDQQRFTISEVAANWHEPMVPQRIMWPSIARANGHIGPTVQLADTSGEATEGGVGGFEPPPHCPPGPLTRFAQNRWEDIGGIPPA